ncbi:hypothetical protein U9M48_023184 [Paspalum notatum var. saurae]|uniref:Uncharacterized protein n=1 Tax=Paspalum notatum var. saurae TaxID=547442 RepID=A0AAQ3TLE4_PASNO
MGACATKPGDLKVKGEAPLAVEDAAEKAKADAVVPVPVAAEADPADAGRRRSLSDLLKQDAETSDDAGGEADQEAAAKAVVAEPASAAGDDAAGGAVMGEDQSSQEAPVQASVTAAAEQQDGTAQELKVGPSGDAAQEAEEEKRVDPESVQVVADAAAPSAEDSKPVANDADSSA